MITVSSVVDTSALRHDRTVHRTHHYRRRTDACAGHADRTPPAAREGRRNTGWRGGCGTKTFLVRRHYQPDSCAPARGAARCLRGFLTCLLGRSVVVQEGMVFRNRALRHKRGAIRPVRRVLEQPVPMLCRAPMSISICRFCSIHSDAFERLCTHDAGRGEHSLVL